MNNAGVAIAAGTPRFNARRLQEDMDLRGWNALDLAKRADLAATTVYRFLSGERQTAKVALRLANVMGYAVRRYRLSSREAA